MGFVGATLLLGGALGVGCGTSSPPPVPAPTPAPAAPTPNPTPAPQPAIPNLAGSWIGTIESSAFATRTVSALLVQAGIDCVDGAWRTEPSEWSGAISGFALPGSFSGLMSFEGPQNGSGLCSGAADRVSGSSTATAIKWTMTTDGHCAGGIAQTVTLRLHR